MVTPGLTNQTQRVHRQSVKYKQRLLFDREGQNAKQANKWKHQHWLTLIGEFLSVEGASSWLGPFTFLFFLAPAPLPPPPPPFSPPTLAGELFCWNSFSWAAHEKKGNNRCMIRNASSFSWLTERKPSVLQDPESFLSLLWIQQWASRIVPNYQPNTDIVQSQISPITELRDVKFVWDEGKDALLPFSYITPLRRSCFNCWLECIATANKIMTITYTCLFNGLLF